MKAQRDSKAVTLIFLEPWRWRVVGGKRYGPAALAPGKRSVTHCAEDCVGPRAGLEGCGKSRPPPGFDPRTIQVVASRYWCEHIVLRMMEEEGYYLTLTFLNNLKPTGYVMHQQFNIQQLYALPTLYLCVLYLSENKQRLVPLTA